ncbi:MAG: 16S rRNA processing protein RimM [Rhodospirillales bacterium]|nr:16S rRNA processing protein RimM [Rhodospirillales bacterium]
MGVIAGAHGLRGHVTVRSFAGTAADLTAYGPLRDRRGDRRFALTLLGKTRDLLIARLDDLHDRGAALALKGTGLFLRREDLPPPEAEEFYYADLIGLAVEDRSGTPLGKVAAVGGHGAGELLTVRRPGGGDLLLPFTRAVVPVVDLAGGRLIADPPAEVPMPPKLQERQDD